MTRSLSVALCTRNGERFIEEQLLSILDQSLLPSQIVISDDASSDNTVAVVTATIGAWLLAHPESGIDVVRLANSDAQGVTANFAQAIAAGSGELVALCDQDDIWPPGRLARIAAEFDSRPELLLLHTDAMLIDADGRATGHTLFESLDVTRAAIEEVHSGNAFAVLMKRNVVTGATTVFRRVLLDHAEPFPSAWVHDEWLAIVAATVGEVDLLEENLLGYRQHGANAIGVERLGLVGKAKRMLEHGADRNRRLLERSEQLAARFPDFSMTPTQTAAVAEKLFHERMRSGLGRHRWTRLQPVLREIATGRYGSFGRGVADAARDLLQPL